MLLGYASSDMLLAVERTKGIKLFITFTKMPMNECFTFISAQQRVNGKKYQGHPILGWSNLI